MAVILDYAFVLLGSFTLGYIWCRYYFDTWISLLLAVLISVVSNCLVRILFKKRLMRRRTKKLSPAAQSRLKNTLIALDAPADYFARIFADNGYAVYKQKQGFTAEIDDQKTYVRTHFKFKALDADTLVEITKTGKTLRAYRSVVFFTDIDKNSFMATDLYKDYLSLFDINATALFLSKNDALPAVKKEGVTPVKRLLFAALKRERAKLYFVSGFFLAIMGLISFMPIYYAVVASLLICLSMYSYFNRKYNVEKDSLL
ncbi:MAG: hypothetical protein PHX51_07480 [Clostridia bacterium]|nr:hypothetical protein [Clostridia bacterium]